MALFVVGTALVFIAGIWPGLRFGAIAAAILILAPPPDEADVLATAAGRATQIVLGAVIATVTSRLLFPASAHRQSARHVSRALDLCADLLAEVNDELLGRQKEPSRIAELDDQILGALQAAESSASQSRRPIERRRRSHDRINDPVRIVRCAQHLWHTIVFAQRTGGGPLASGPREPLADPLYRLSEAARAHLLELSQAIRSGDPLPRIDAVRDARHALEIALAEVRRQGATRSLPADEAERVFALSLAMDHLVSNLDSLTKLARPPQEQR